MMFIKRMIVIGLDWSCYFVDYMWSWPAPFRWINTWIGCPNGMALWAIKLDERWGTGRWK